NSHCKVRAYSCAISEKAARWRAEIASSFIWKINADRAAPKRRIKPAGRFRRKKPGPVREAVMRNVRIQRERDLRVKPKQLFCLSPTLASKWRQPGEIRNLARASGLLSRHRRVTLIDAAMQQEVFK